MIRENIEGAVKGISTLDMEKKTARLGGLDHEISIFISEDYEKELGEQNRFVIDELKNLDRRMSLKGE